MLVLMLPIVALSVLVFACRFSRPPSLTFIAMSTTLLSLALLVALAVLIIGQDHESQYIGIAEGLGCLTTLAFLAMFAAIPIDAAVQRCIRKSRKKPEIPS